MNATSSITRYRKTQNALLLFLFCVCTGGMLPAQDIHFSQFYMSPLTVNPAMAGMRYSLEAGLNYKNQWQSVATPYKTAAFSYDMRLHKGGKNPPKTGFFAAGVNGFSDKAGDSKVGITQGNLTAAYHVLLNQYSTLGAGVQGGFGQYSMNAAAFQWGSQYDVNAYNAALPTGETATVTPSFTYADVSAGLAWNFDNTLRLNQVINNRVFKSHLGFSMYHVNRPKFSFYGNSAQKLYMKMVIHGGLLYGIPNSALTLMPDIMYSKQGPQQEILAGLMLRYSTTMNDSKHGNIKNGPSIGGGLYFRAKDALTAALLLEYASYAIGFSYDINVSGLQAASAKKGGLEIALRVAFVNSNGTKKSARSFL